MKVQTDITLLEEILAGWKDTIGDEYQGYRNHVYRMVQFCFALRECSEEEKEKILIAGAFHDIGIWIEDTVDYIPPSLPPAREYLEKRGLSDWYPEIERMITEHHKVTEYKDPEWPLVEVFRRGDLVDFSCGTVTHGIPKSFIREVRRQIPNAGFHRNLGKRAAKWFIRHPLRPAPMMKW